MQGMQQIPGARRHHTGDGSRAWPAAQRSGSHHDSVTPRTLAPCQIHLGRSRCILNLKLIGETILKWSEKKKISSSVTALYRYKHSPMEGSQDSSLSSFFFSRRRRTIGTNGTKPFSKQKVLEHTGAVQRIVPKDNAPATLHVSDPSAWPALQTQLQCGPLTFTQVTHSPALAPQCVFNPVIFCLGKEFTVLLW